MYLRTQVELLNGVRNSIRDTGQARWLDSEIYRCLNGALGDWATRVKMPMVYVLPDGWDSATYEYTLPAYVRPPIQPQVRFDTQPSYGGGNTWADIRSFAVESSATGDLVLRIRLFPGDPNVTHEGRIIWYASNSYFPLTAPALAATISDADTSLTVNAALDVADTGWVKIENEWICYAGVTRNEDNTVLNNLQRGLEDTSALAHNSATVVYWGVCAPNQALFQQLAHQTFSKMHLMFLTDASPQERDLHERMMLYHDNKVAESWRRYAPRAPKMVVDLEHL